MPLTPEGGGEETNLPDNTEENHKSWEKDDGRNLEKKRQFLLILSQKKSYFFVYISQISQLILRCTEDKRQYDTKQKLTMGLCLAGCLFIPGISLILCIVNSFNNLCPTKLQHNKRRDACNTTDLSYDTQGLR